MKSQNTQIEISFGWEKIIEILDKLRERGYSKVIGIIDNDLRKIIPEEIHLYENVVVTDDHDINILCLEESFSVIFESNNSEEKTENFKSRMNVSCVKSYTYSLIKPLSYLRILNKRHELNLVFKSNDSKKNRFDYSKFIDKDTYTLVSLEKLVETLTNFSRNKTHNLLMTNAEILAMLNKIIDEEIFEDRLLTNGHDFGNIICIGLKKALGSVDIEPETFLRECILAYDSNKFTTTKMFSSIKTQESIQQTKYLNF